MTRMCSAWVPHNLTREQLDKRVQVCREWLEMIETEPDITSWIITFAESRVLWLRPSLKTRKCNMENEISMEKKVCQTISEGKWCWSLSEYYCGVLAKLREHVARKHPEIKKSWLLHHDNAPPTQITFHPSFFTKMENLSVLVSTLQSRHHPLWFLVVPHCQKRLTWLEIWQWRWCPECCDKCSKTHSFRRIPKTNEGEMTRTNAKMYQL